MKHSFWRKKMNCFVLLISELYPLTRFQLIQYEEIVDWNRVKSNSFIRWDQQMETTFAEGLESANGFQAEKIPVRSEHKGEYAEGYIALGYPKANNVYVKTRGAYISISDALERCSFWQIRKARLS